MDYAFARREFMRALGGFTASVAIPCTTIARTTEPPRKVVVLGAGWAGLSAAHELQKAGVEVTVLEARDRLGGIVWTLRGGDTIRHLGEEAQNVLFSEGNYLNAGAGRIPSHHDNIMAYARELCVDLEVLVNESRGNLVFRHLPNGNLDRVRMRQVANDLRGHLSALLERALRSGVLDQELSPTVRGQLSDFLKIYGDLQPNGRFNGTARSGYLTPPGATSGQHGTAVTPLTLDSLLADVELTTLLYETDILMQPTMFQAAGGMDHLVKAMGRALRNPVRMNAEVQEIRRDGSGVRVIYRDHATGAYDTVLADHAIITIPLPILARIKNDFSPPLTRIIEATRPSDAVKIAFESTPFWEKEQVYGGNSYVDGDTGVIWYPSGQFQAERQVLIAAYGWDEKGTKLSALGRSEQIATGRAVVDRMHPGHGKDLQKPVVVDWRKVPFSESAWIDWHAGGNDSAGAQVLNAGDGPFSFAGSYLSAYSGHWQEGAILSGKRAARQLVGA